MKSLKLFSIIGYSLLTTTAFSQDWQLGGNNNLPALNNPTNQTIGTNINRPLRFETVGIQRMHINEERLSNINQFTNVNTTGFVGIGPNTIGMQFPNGLWDDAGPFSLLHLNGVNGVGQFNVNLGYRNWWKTGITLTDDLT